MGARQGTGRWEPSDSVRRQAERTVLRALSLACLACIASFATACSLDRSPLEGEPSRGTGGDQGGGQTGGAGGAGGTSGFAGSGGLGGTGGIIAITGGTGGGFGPDAGPTGGTSGFGDAAIDGAAGETAAIGAPCATDTDCASPGIERTCIAENALAPFLVLPGGYCSQFCDSGLACEAGATCVLIPLGMVPLFVCMTSCVDDNDCRATEGYGCNDALTSGSKVCSLVN